VGGDTDELTFSEQLKRIFEFEPNAEVTLDQIASACILMTFTAS